METVRKHPYAAAAAGITTAAVVGGYLYYRSTRPVSSSGSHKDTISAAAAAPSTSAPAAEEASTSASKTGRGYEVVCDGDVCRMVPLQRPKTPEQRDEAQPAATKQPTQEELEAAGPLVALLGASLTDGTGASRPTVEALAGKEAVLLYFSASWCPPCKHFSPQLAATYKKLKAVGKGIEVVLISGDQNEAEYSAYLGGQPWLAVPFKDRARKEALSKRYKVAAIPTLVAVGPDGALINADCREAVSTDPEGEHFPWRPVTLQHVLQHECGALRGKDGDVAFSDLEGKVVGLYFSAHWCPPCRAFTPDLVHTYKAVRAAGHDFEIIYVSLDREEAAFEEYFAEMSWLTVPFGAAELRQKLQAVAKVEGIPTLVILDKDLQVVTAQGRGAVGGDREGANFPWHPEPVMDLEASFQQFLQTPSVIVLMGGVEASKQQEIMASIKPVAKRYADEAKASGLEPEIVFFAATRPGPTATKICELTKHNPDSSEPNVVLLDLADDGGFYVAEGVSVVEAALAEWVEAYRCGRLPRLQLE